MFKGIHCYKHSNVLKETNFSLDKEGYLYTITYDALPNSFIDLNVSLKWKHRKSKELGTCSLACNTLRGRRACWSYGMGLERMTNT